jgi:hypothetical protein
MSRWARFFRRRERMMEDLDQEIRDSIERETQDNIDHGMSPEEAHYAALRLLRSGGRFPARFVSSRPFTLDHRLSTVDRFILNFESRIPHRPALPRPFCFAWCRSGRFIPPHGGVKPPLRRTVHRSTRCAPSDRPSPGAPRGRLLSGLLTDRQRGEASIRHLAWVRICHS